MDNMIKLEIGSKLPKELGISALPQVPGVQAQYIVCLGPGLFLLVAQSDWNVIEYNSINKEIEVYCSEIDDVIEFLVKTESILLEVPYNPNKTAPEIEFSEFKGNEGLGLYLIMCSQDAIIQSMRLISLQQNNSNAIVKTLQEIKRISDEEYEKKYENLCNSFSIEEVMANSFIHEKFNGQ